MKKTCAICKEEFEATFHRQNVCSFQCRQTRNKWNARLSMRKAREKKQIYKPCEVCGWNKTVELHHEPWGLHHLCPNHHALITRNIATLDEMLKNPSAF